MVQVSYPGVYIREVSSGVRTITGVSTSVAAFIGEAKRGTMFEPTRVLGFVDYERLFSADTSLGEMTDQVRQFFLNGGQQAFIVRVADAVTSTSAAIQLRNGANAAVVLTLTAKSAGTDGNNIRARVDYNTSAPERTFNLRVYREIFDVSGTPQIIEEEVYTDLTMDAASSRSVVKVLEQTSSLVKATIGTVTAINGFSATAKTFAATTDLNTAVQTAIADAGGTFGTFTIKLGTTDVRTVSITAAAVTAVGAATAIQNAINALGGPTVAVTHISPDGPLIIRAATAIDVIIDRGSSHDIALGLGLGVAQDGVEVGAFAPDRPAPSGFASQIGNFTTPANLLDSLIEFTGTPRASMTNIAVAGPRPFTAPLSLGAGEMGDNGLPAGQQSFKNVRARLVAIADAINLVTSDWRAEVHGYRLVLIPRFGDANAGTGHTITSAGAYNIGDNTGTANLFGPSLSSVFGYSLGTSGTTGAGIPQTGGVAGNDGNPPVLTDYRTAFTAIDKKVDLFNLMVLPKSARGNPDLRSSVWGEASVFCDRRRAFLIVDTGPAAISVDTVLSGLTDLRAGVVKDHAAVYWPPIKLPVSGTTKTIDPSGTIAGLMARTDSSRGVWKAPAGLEADLRGVVGVQFAMSDPDNGLLNPQAVNAIRSFPNGIVSWGARTMDGFDNSGNNDYKYVPVRRFALFIEESLYRGLKFAVFEPNDEQLWAQIRLAVGAFMNNLFRQGAFAGKTTRDAYFVKVDSETTTQNDVNLGIVNVQVGFAPLKPAEFIVVTIKQQAGQVQV
jgi:uncharacterized protein